MKKTLRQLLLVILDVGAIHLGFILAFWIRFSGVQDVPAESAYVFFETYLALIVPITVIKITVFAVFRMYNSLWRYASVEELIQVVMGCFFGTAAMLMYFHFANQHLPRGIYILTLMTDIMFLGGIRFSYRSLRTIRDVGFWGRSDKSKRVLVIGAGEAGAHIVRELKSNESLHRIPVAVIDDDHGKKGRLINGVPVIGGKDQLALVVLEKKIDQIILALPSASRAVIREYVDLCTPLKAELKIVPGVGELIDGQVEVRSIRSVEIDDLLGRDEISLDIESLEAEIGGKRILVTGGGGSIGSEICRQIIRFRPERIMVLDIAENGAYELEQELRRIAPEVPVTVRIASVRERSTVFEIFRKFRPHIVYHAAAHKHVPLMEAAPKEAVKNNVFGTLNVMQAARKCGAEKFVQISTDKAVNPTNVMGATKRICEMMAQALNVHSKTEFVAVRFGNVLGSNGSVIPLFKKQIAAGGPVTVTHPDIIRYFMTIPEACRLVIQAGAIAKGGEIFILDMGEPVRIVDLARNLIRLSGFEPDKDIRIEFTGLRPGEKLYEELLLDKEKSQMTRFEKIFIEQSAVTDFAELAQMLKRLRHSLVLEDGLVVSELKGIVPEFGDDHRD